MFAFHSVLPRQELSTMKALQLAIAVQHFALNAVMENFVNNVNLESHFFSPEMAMEK